MNHKWEYLVLDIVLIKSEWHPHVINGNVLENWEKLSLMEKLSELGHDSWELVTSSTINNKNETLYFKRKFKSLSNRLIILT